MRRTTLVLTSAALGAVLVSLSGCKPGESSYAMAAFANPGEITDGGAAKITVAVMKNEKSEKDIDVGFSTSGCGTLSKKSEKTNADGNAIVAFTGGGAADRDCVGTITAQTHGLRSNVTITVHPKPVEADVTPAAGTTLPTPVPHAKVDVKVSEVVKGKQWKWSYAVTMKDGGFDRIILTFDAPVTVTAAGGGNAACMLPGNECNMWKVAYPSYTSSAEFTVDSGSKPGGNVTFEVIRGTNVVGRSEDYSATLKVTGPKSPE